MFKGFLKLVSVVLTIIVFTLNQSLSEIVNKIVVTGNERISEKTIKLFSEVSLNDNLNESDLNDILKNLYKTNFFKDVSVKFNENILLIDVEENPIIEKIKYEGIKSNKVLNALKEEALIKDRSSYSENLILEEKNRLNILLKNLGYYNSELEILVETKENNLVDLIFDITLGEKAKIKKITFIGNKIFKDRKLRRIIASSEYKFWKFISGRKFLNENIVEFDKRLLENFYKNRGYYNVKVNSSFAKMLEDNEFELIFNIDAKSKILFGDLSLTLPTDFNEENFNNIKTLFKKIKGEPYSINSINNILDEIDLITNQEQYKFINATVTEDLKDNFINLEFKIKESEKYYVKKINIFGNNVTSENVIRNQFEVDEGDPFNEILLNKSINNIKSLNIFKSVKKEIIDDKNSKTKIINISIEEKPTGEINAMAGLGTEGASIGFGVKENNFLGKGISLDSNFLISSD